MTTTISITQLGSEYRCWPAEAACCLLKAADSRQDTITHSSGLVTFAQHTEIGHMLVPMQDGETYTMQCPLHCTLRCSAARSTSALIHAGLQSCKDSPQLAIQTLWVPTKATTAVLPTRPACRPLSLNSSSVLMKASRSTPSIMPEKDAADVSLLSPLLPSLLSSSESLPALPLPALMVLVYPRGMPAAAPAAAGAAPLLPPAALAACAGCALQVLLQLLLLQAASPAEE
jgi:hypothetical protein